jgi:hypothetical protein
VAEKIEGYWRLVDPVWEQIDIYEGPEVFLATYRAAERQAGLLFAAHYAESEICNGGFHQLFWNSTGVLAPEAVEGFQVIGMIETAETVSDAMKLLGERYPRDRGERKNILASIQKKMFSELDHQFFGLIGTENGGFEVAADRFASQILD